MDTRQFSSESRSAPGEETPLTETVSQLRDTGYFFPEGKNNVSGLSRYVARQQAMGKSAVQVASRPLTHRSIKKRELDGIATSRDAR